MRNARAVLLVALATGLGSSWAAAEELTFKGEVVKADEAAGTLTLRHDEPGTVGGAGGATADFKVKDGLVFNAVRAGDKVQVVVDQVDGNMTITKLQKE